MENKNNKGLIVGLLIGIIIMLVIFIILVVTNTISLTAKTNSAITNDDNQSANEIEELDLNDDSDDGIITVDMLYGTYNWNKNYTNEAGNDINLKVILVLNSDGTANYEASDGYSYESTKGTYKYENNQIIYTREYYNYPNQDNSKFEEDNKVENFEVINENTLQNNFYDQLTELIKQ